MGKPLSLRSPVPFGSRAEIAGGNGVGLCSRGVQVLRYLLLVETKGAKPASKSLE